MSSWGTQSAFGTKPPPGVSWPFLSHREEQQDTTHTSSSSSSIKRYTQLTIKTIHRLLQATLGRVTAVTLSSLIIGSRFLSGSRSGTSWSLKDPGTRVLFTTETGVQFVLLCGITCSLTIGNIETLNRGNHRTVSATAATAIFLRVGWDEGMTKM